MAQGFYFQSQFNGGELGASMIARHELAVYKKGLKTLKNFRCKIQGGLQKRNGFVYKYAAKNADKKCRLLKFIFSETDNVVIEMGENYFRFIDNDVQVESGGSPYEVAHTYTEAQLPEVKYRQIGDIVYFTHPSHRPRKLTRLASDNWTLEDVHFTRGPVNNENEDDTITVYISTGSSTAAAGELCTVTASSTLFTADDLGWTYRWVSDDGANTGYAKMETFVSGTVADFRNTTDNSFMHGSGNALYRWSPPAFSPLKGFPRAISFHEQRLFLAGTDTYPLRIWASVSGGAYENFEKGTNDDDGLDFELAGQINTIQWLKSDGLYLTCGTLGGIGFIGTGSLDSALTPTNVKANTSSSYGSNSIDAEFLNEHVMYIASNAAGLNELNYDGDTLRYISLDMTQQNENIIASAEYIDRIEQPDLTVAIVNSGDISFFLRDKANQAQAWYKYETSGDIESIAVLPATNDDKIWAVVKRNNARYIELLADDSDVIYVDSAVTYSGAATRTISGLSHLNGLTVQLQGDGAYSGEYVVSGGSITIPNDKPAVSEAVIGLSYNADLELMPIDSPRQYTSTSKFFKKRVTRAKMLVQDTGVVSIGTGFDRLKTLPFRRTSDLMDNAIVNYGVDYPEMIEETVDGNFGYNETFCLRSNTPFPCTVHGIGIHYDAGND